MCYHVGSEQITVCDSSCALDESFSIWACDIHIYCWKLVVLLKKQDVCSAVSGN